MKVAVVGHVEWVDFVRVEQVPRAGEVVHGREVFARAGGGGGVAAVVLARLAETTEFFCALGRDAIGDGAAAELESRGVTARVAWRESPTRRAVTLLDQHGERTIVTLGERLEPRGEDELPWEGIEGCAGVYLTAGDREAVHRARAAPVLVATPRARAALEDETVILDALVFSARDADEREWAQRVAGRTRLLVATDGAAGGHWWGREQGSWRAAAPPAVVHDAYGCGDSFAAAFMFALASGSTVGEAAALGAQFGAAALGVAGAP